MTKSYVVVSLVSDGYDLQYLLTSHNKLFAWMITFFSLKYCGFLILNYDFHRELCKDSGENMNLAQMTIMIL